MAEATPADEQAARTYESELLRAGERDAVAQRYRFKFLCAQGFDDLEPTDDPEERFCTECQRNVRFVHLVDELAEQVAAGGCVAIEEAELGSVIEGLLEDPERHSAVEEGTSCVVLGDRPVTRQWRGRVEVLPRDDDPLRAWDQEQAAREAEERTFWAAARERLAELVEAGAEAYLVMDVLREVDALLDDPTQPGAWTARLDVPLELELKGHFGSSVEPQVYVGSVRNGLLRLTPQSNRKPPAWQRGDVVLRRPSG